MITLLDYSIAINIIGLALISAAESWRPGFVSGAVNVGIVWLCAVVVIGAGLLLKRRIVEDKR